MTERLNAPWGSRIDRSRRLDFSFDGKPAQGFAGDTVASALLGSDRWVLSRSFKYHRPRGPLTMAGQDSNTLVQIGAEPNVLADRHPLAAGLAVSAQNTTHGADRDLNSALDRFGRFMPVGFYYRTFFGPRKSSWLRYWEPLIRKSAGLGRIDTALPPAHYRKQNLHCDVLVVGAGPAGMAAARTAALAGAEVVLVDSEPETGGALTYGRYADSLLREQREALESAGVRILLGATCNGWFADNFLPVLQGDLLWRIRAAQVVIAAGTQEQPLVFRNNDLPGIVTASAVQRMLRHYGVRPASRSVVFAGTPHGAMAALDLAEAGVPVAAVLVPAEARLPEALLSELRAEGLRIVEAASVVGAQGTRGNRRLKSLRIETPAGQESLHCDLAVIDAGSTPGYQLPLHAGAKLGFDEVSQTYSLTNLPASMRLAGSVAGIHGIDSVIRSGEIAGSNAARALGLAADAPPALPDADAGFHRTYPVPPAHNQGRDFIDFDEDLQVKDIVNAVADGYAELELVKRYSTVGMGPSQGRHSALATAKIVAEATGRSVAQIGITTSRPPFGPEKLGLLAGPQHNHARLTPMDGWHRDAGAKMIPAGIWWRPLYYGASAEVVADEIRTVRDGVGMLDVSTLGKLAVRGPDAGAFLDRIYTMAHEKQPVGRVRYCLMLNEMGSVIDDGVAYRIGPEEFYVTATTGAVDRVFAEMSLLNAQWRMKVDIQNITAAFAAINVTGPKARQVLQALESDIDLTADGFPYLEGRTGHLAGCPVRIMRIGFTGELSYELHTPRSYALTLWNALLEAGAPQGLKPYGLEASRILRLEKGHIIIGQDTDALSSPDELGMEWALSKKKPYYIGKPAVEKRRGLGLQRALIRFELSPEDGAKLGESCLVLRGGEPAGFVTSIGVSPGLGRMIGLAYAHPEDNRPGARITLRDRAGTNVEATVVAHAFYDPENKRQEM
ncbi:(2Fe-2S)-binding protein [Paracoccus sp. Z118]|uniref:2Fe-2S iron-sulfur cluster-binding protein n=1 Tax=Paracoccus sp. Z118 TaxID=2851017 RepID=UPI001C2BFF5A|nr:2Fe-2S iron-sulfur cluster-binding protein [Paracoccus sp. Z118]MBV0893330.1 (2Fe-2S)-binding protein [Paracoccus sp. Z118]